MLADDAGRLTWTGNPQNIATSWSYGSNGWLQEQHTGGQIHTYWKRNGLGQVQGMKNLNSVYSPLSEFSSFTDASKQYRYDGAGNLTDRFTYVPGAMNLSGQYRYSYDSRDQLGREDAWLTPTGSGTTTTNSGYSRTWGFDASGNPNAASYTNARSGITSTWGRSFNPSNQETTLGAQGQPAFAYDGSGNPTLYRGASASYNARNQMLSWGLFRAGYRADGKRAWKATADAAGVEGSRTYFLYDGDALLCELDSTGRVTSTSTWGANGLVAKAHTSYDAQGAPSTMGLLYAFDERGNTVNVVNQYGGLEDNSAFDAIGGRVWGRGDSTGFGGQWGYYTDGETGLILCTQRYYDPAAQRWVTRDPIGFAGGINLYGYVGNNPMRRVDPQGLSSDDDLLNAYQNQLETGVRGWFDNTYTRAAVFLGDFLAGTGSTDRSHGESSLEAYDFSQSRGATEIRRQIRSVGYRRVPDPQRANGRKWNGIGTFGAFCNSARDIGNATEWQVGGFDWQAERIGNSMHITVRNDADFNSFLFHIPHFGYDRAANGFGPMGRINQTIDWYEPVPTGY